MLDAVSGGRSAEPHDANGELRDPRLASLVRNRDPNLSGKSGSDPVDLKRRQQADDGVGDSRANGCQCIELRRLDLLEPVEASTNLLDLTLLHESLQVMVRDPCFLRIPRTEEGPHLGFLLQTLKIEAIGSQG
jgi:hypothetical protein